MNGSSLQKPKHPSLKVTFLLCSAAVLPGCRQVADDCWGGRTRNKKCQLGPCTEMMLGLGAAGGRRGWSLLPPPLPAQLKPLTLQDARSY